MFIALAFDFPGNTFLRFILFVLSIVCHLLTIYFESFSQAKSCGCVRVLLHVLHIKAFDFNRSEVLETDGYIYFTFPAYVEGFFLIKFREIKLNIRGFNKMLP